MNKEIAQYNIFSLHLGSSWLSPATCANKQSYIPWLAATTAQPSPVPSQHPPAPSHGPRHVSLSLSSYQYISSHPISSPHSSSPCSSFFLSHHPLWIRPFTFFSPCRPTVACTRPRNILDLAPRPSCRPPVRPSIFWPASRDKAPEPPCPHLVYHPGAVLCETSFFPSY